MIDQNKNNLPLDLSYLSEMSGDSPDFMLEMLDAFQAQTPITMAELEKAVVAQDWKSASEAAHKIKPTFYYMGREDARDHMQEIERNTRELKDLDQIPAAFQAVKDFVVVLYQQLEAAKEELKKRL
ncbi:MAG: Hpt domain-containing protein [Pedobacter sp.]|nr:Hpt domain-containing protein [Pedobacter sp.]MDQ8053257.1 Hpt domain-containing protein [Pedobacter sp.]